MLPEVVRRHCGESRSRQLRSFIGGLTTATLASGRVGMDEELADALAAFRQGNYDRVYFRPASVAQGNAVIALLRGLVEHFADQPNRIPGVDDVGGLAGGSTGAVQAAVAYVAGMTDRFAMASAVTDLGWDRRSLPRGIEEIGPR
jgi:dGTPase